MYITSSPPPIPPGGILGAERVALFNLKPSLQIRSLAKISAFYIGPKLCSMTPPPGPLTFVNALGYHPFYAIFQNFDYYPVSKN